MKVTLITLSDRLLTERDYRQVLKVKINGKTEFHVSDGEPEDSNISRNFNDCYNVVDLMRKAYDAGKNGEEFIEDHKVVDEL